MIANCCKHKKNQMESIFCQREDFWNERKTTDFQDNVEHADAEALESGNSILIAQVEFVL